MTSPAEQSKVQAREVMLATRHRFWRDDRGDRRRIAALSRYLMKRFRLTVVYLGNLEDEDRRKIVAEYREARWFVIHPEGPAAPMPRQPTLADYYSESNQRRFRALCRRLAPETLIVEYLRVGYLVDGLRDVLPRPCLMIVDTLDVLHQRAEAFLRRGEAHWVAIGEEEERRELEKFDAVMAIQEHDAEVFRRMLPDKRVVVTGHHVPIVRHETRRSRPVEIGFVASAAAPNRHGADAFLKNVWPSLRARHDGRVHLTLVGGVCEHLKDTPLPDGVVLRGHAADLDSIYGDMDILINPAAFGGGLKIKCVEALSHGRVLVTTPVGAQGMESGAGRAFFVCADEAETLRTLSALAADEALRARTAEEARRFAEEHFSEEAAYGELARMLEERPPRRRSVCARGLDALRAAFSRDIADVEEITP